MGRGGRKASIADVLEMTVTEALAASPTPRSRGAARAAGGCRPRLPEARPARADAVRRRGATPEARRPSAEAGGDDGTGTAPMRPRQTVPVRRADHRPAFRGRGAAARRVPQAAGRRSLAAGDRAQPRRDPRGGLDHRPGPRAATPAGSWWRPARPPSSPDTRASHTGRALAEYERALAGGGTPRRAATRNGLRRRWRWSSGGAPTDRRATRSSSTTRANTTCAASTSRSRTRSSRSDRRLGLGQVDAGVRHPVQRGPAPLPRVAERLCAASSCSRPRAPRSTRSSASRRRSRSSSAPAGWRPQEHGAATLTEVHHHPAAAVRQARRAALPRLRRADRAADAGGNRRTADAGRIAAQADAARAAGHRAQGPVHRLAKWAANKGCAAGVDGELTPVKFSPRLDRFKEHSIELPVATLEVGPKSEDALRRRSARRRVRQQVAHALPAGA